MMERWVKCASASYTDGRAVYINMARVTHMHRDDARGITVVEFGAEESHTVKETPEDLIAKAEPAR